MPVSVDSLTTAEPRSSKQSAGTRVVSFPLARFNDITSPGSKSVELTEPEQRTTREVRLGSSANGQCGRAVLKNRSSTP